MNICKNVKYDIRKANQEDLTNLLIIVKDVVENKKNSGLNWDDTYPNREVYMNDIINNKLYVITKKDKILGAIAICEDLDEEYKNIKWTLEEGLVIHRLIISRNYSNLGLGTLLMKHAEKEAKCKGFKSIKLDTYSKNIKAINFYKKNGYKLKGEINLMPWEEKFLCFEKLL